MYSISQDFDWWNSKHGWDQVTNWHKYMKLTAAHMGPNALPVPDIQNGTVPEVSEFKVAFDSHFSKGDNTQNLFLECFFLYMKVVLEHM